MLEGSINEEYRIVSKLKSASSRHSAQRWFIAVADVSIENTARRGSRKYGDRVFWDLKIFWTTPSSRLGNALFFRRCSHSRGHSLIHQGLWNDLKVERGAKIGRRVKLGSGGFCPEKYLSHASFKSKEMATLKAIVMFILYQRLKVTSFFLLMKNVGGGYSPQPP